VEASLAAADENRSISRGCHCAPYGAEVPLCRISPGRPWRRGGGMRWCECFIVLPLSVGRGSEGERRVAVRSSAPPGHDPLLRMPAAQPPPLLRP
jgi:hypothetical protein